ncbi:MAG: TIGR00341 family protein [Phycisphaerae bacterium]|nr:TIGR00341 family protein [Phycisphaerae bacterium]
MVVQEAAGADLAALSEELRVLGLWREQLQDEQVLLRLLVPSEKTEAVIQELETRFQTSPGFRLVIFEVQATLPQPEIEEPEQEEGQQSQEEEQKDPLRIACDELVQKLSSGAVVNRVFLVTVVLSTVVAAIGLIRGNVAVIIGAMVIAPLLGPNMTLAVATTLGDPKLARNALRVNAIGLLLALLLAILIGVAVPVDPSVQEIADRTKVGLSDVVLALAAGSAGALAFTTGLSAAVVGVMVAVALLPPLATVGLLLGSGHPQLALGALLLTLTNIVCVNLAGVATFLWQRVNPRHWWEADRAKRMVRVAGAIWLALLALLVALILAARY